MESNLTLTLGFKGQGRPNGVTAAVPNGVWTLGGFQDSSDTQTAKFGVVMSSDPSGMDGDFFCGANTITGVASVYTSAISVTGTTVPANTNINVDGTVIPVASGINAASVATLIAAGSYYRYNVVVSGTTNVVFTSKLATKITAPTFTDGSPSSNIVMATSPTVPGVMGSVMRGVTIYDAGVAENDPAKPNYMLQGAPVTLAYRGQIWLSTWIGATTWSGLGGSNRDSNGTICTGAISTPVLGAVVVASNVTGEIGLLPFGSSAPTGYTVISASVKSVSTDTNGVLIYLTI
jgi:hypothetical protein